MSTSESSSSGSSTDGASTPPSTVPTSPDLHKLSLDEPAPLPLVVEETYALPASLRPRDEWVALQCPPLPAAFPPLPLVKVLDGPLDKGTPDDWIAREASLIRLCVMWSRLCEDEGAS